MAGPTISAFIKTVVWIAVVCKYHNLVAPLLQANRSIHDEAFCTANAQIGMEEDNGSFTIRRRDLWSALL